jgi:hypothetical protein
MASFTTFAVYTPWASAFIGAPLILREHCVRYDRPQKSCGLWCFPQTLLYCKISKHTPYPHTQATRPIRSNIMERIILQPTLVDLQSGHKHLPQIQRYIAYLVAGSDKQLAAHNASLAYDACLCGRRFASARLGSSLDNRCRGTGA